MYMIAGVSQYVAVASFMEAWIEINHHPQSLPLQMVASFMEAWIEILFGTARSGSISRRLLHGGVD